MKSDLSKNERLLEQEKNNVEDRLHDAEEKNKASDDRWMELSEKKKKLDEREQWLDTKENSLKAMKGQMIDQQARLKQKANTVNVNWEDIKL